MTFIAFIPLIVCLLGLAFFFGCSGGVNKANIAKLAVHMFWTGLLVSLFAVMGKVESCSTMMNQQSIVTPEHRR